MHPLSKNEWEIMNIFWSTSDTLSPAKITEVADNPSWKSGSVYQLVNTLLEKGYLAYSHSEKGKRNRISFYKASITLDQYTAMQFKANRTYRQKIPNLISALVSDIENLEQIEQLEEILRKKKENL